MGKKKIIVQKKNEDSSKKQEEATGSPNHTKMARTIDLPSELLHYVLCYLTQDFRDIIHFSTTCKRWKLIGDSTVLWLEKPLFFYSTDRYHEYKTDGALGGKKLLGDIFPFKVKFGSSLSSYPTVNFKVIFEVDDMNLASNECMRPYEKAREVRQQFMQLFLKYHKLWEFNYYWGIKF